MTRISLKIIYLKFRSNLPWANDLNIFEKIDHAIVEPIIYFSGNDHGRAFRDVDMEEKVLQLTRKAGIGAQFGGKYFCHDVRVVRLPRHGASCPIGIGVSCSADRQVGQLWHIVLYSVD